MATNLSEYFPIGTAYFHFRPLGENSNFFYSGEAWLSAMGASRILTCAEESVKVIVFRDITTPKIWSILQDELGTLTTDIKNVFFLDTEPDSDTKVYEQNSSVKNALIKTVPKGKFVMSQPYLDDNLTAYNQINAELNIWLNDKLNMAEFIPKEFLLAQTLVFPNGDSFANYSKEIPIPCVVKVASSCGGHGVQVCITKEELEASREKFKKISGKIFIEEYKEVVKNYCMQFGVPFNKDKNIEMIGVSEQLTSPSGKFLGGIVDYTKKLPLVDEIKKVMLENILPKVRELGWYGVGGIDVIVDTEGKFYFIDCNFRMTATMPYLFQSNKKQVQKPMVTFTASISAQDSSFKKEILPLAKHGDKNQLLNIINLAEKDGHYWFHTGLLYDDESRIKEQAKDLLKLGLKAEVLNTFANM